MHRTLLPHAQGTAPLGAALPGPHRTSRGAARLQGHLQPAMVDRAPRVSLTSGGEKGVCAHASGLNTLTRLSNESGAVQTLNALSRDGSQPSLLTYRARTGRP